VFITGVAKPSFITVGTPKLSPLIKAKGQVLNLLTREPSLYQEAVSQVTPEGVPLSSMVKLEGMPLLKFSLRKVCEMAGLCRKRKNEKERKRYLIGSTGKQLEI
jgi:hypothetical protein